MQAYNFFIGLWSRCCIILIYASYGFSVRNANIRQLHPFTLGLHFHGDVRQSTKDDTAQLIWSSMYGVIVITSWL